MLCSGCSELRLYFYTAVYMRGSCSASESSSSLLFARRFAFLDIDFDFDDVRRSLSFSAFLTSPATRNSRQASQSQCLETATSARLLPPILVHVTGRRWCFLGMRRKQQLLHAATTRHAKFACLPACGSNVAHGSWFMLLTSESMAAEELAARRPRSCPRMKWIYAASTATCVASLAAASGSVSGVTVTIPSTSVTSLPEWKAHHTRQVQAAKLTPPSSMMPIPCPSQPIMPHMITHVTHVTHVTQSHMLV